MPWELTILVAATSQEVKGFVQKTHYLSAQKYIQFWLIAPYPRPIHRVLLMGGGAKSP